MNTAMQGPERRKVENKPQLTLADRVEALKLELPEDHTPYTDKYFLRTSEILKKLNLNPFVRAQFSIRQGPGEVAGLEKALAIVDKYSDFRKNGGRIFALKEGDQYQGKETLMLLEGRAQDIVELETMILGVLSKATTCKNEGVKNVDLEQVKRNTRAVIDLIGDRPLIYMGARHWGYDEDAAIARAVFEAGGSETSTDIGAQTARRSGVGTIPHYLENIFAWKYGKDWAVLKAAEAFDDVIDPKVPRIALIDYNNKEIDDSLKVALSLNTALYAVRVDTCGENIAEGAWKTVDEIPAEIRAQIAEADLKYWAGSGVSISGVSALRTALDSFGYQEVKIVLSSGFGDTRKVQAFLNAEKILGQKLFDALGVGGLYTPRREAKLELVAVADKAEDLDKFPMAKVGRGYRPNPRLQEVVW